MIEGRGGGDWAYFGWSTFQGVSKGEKERGR